MLARHERNAQGMRHMTTESYSPPTYTTTHVDVSACVSSGWQGRPRALLRAWQHHAAHCCPKSCPACFQPWPCVPEWIPAGVPEVAGDPRTASAEHARLPWLAWLAAVATVGRAAVVTALLVAVGRTAGAVQAAEVEEVAEAEESAAMVAAELVAVATVKQQAARAGGRARGLSPHREPPPCRTPRRSHLPPHHSRRLRCPTPPLPHSRPPRCPPPPPLLPLLQRPPAPSPPSAASHCSHSWPYWQAALLLLHTQRAAPAGQCRVCEPPSGRSPARLLRPPDPHPSASRPPLLT